MSLRVNYHAIKKCLLYTMAHELHLATPITCSESVYSKYFFIAYQYYLIICFVFVLSFAFVLRIFKKKYLNNKSKIATEIVQFFDFSLRMSFKTPTFKVFVFASDLEVGVEVNEYCRHSNSNFAHHSGIHRSLFKV